MNLIIDEGNSFVKLAVFQENELIHKRAVPKVETEKNIFELGDLFPQIKKSIFSSVVGHSFSLFSTEIKPLILNATTKLPFTNLYATPETLGNDRKALIAAASKYYENKNVLVIDAGTCLTFDFKNEKNEYLGGAISPGLKMRFKALHQFTANLPLLEATEEVFLTGNSTSTSIISGVFSGMQKEINGTIEAYQALYKDLTIIFTGGDAQFLSVNLKNGIFANSNFLLEGLNYILEFNKNQ